MILDTMKNASTYVGLNARIDKALAVMKEITPENFVAGRVELEGDRLFMNLVQYETHSVEGRNCEAHRKYVDVMYMVEGEETIYVKPTDEICTVT